MNKHINFEDNIFILNVRIRMIHDTLTIEADPGLFLEKTLDDLEFISGVLDALLANLIENVKFIERNSEFNNLSDLEWQFDQLLTRFCNGRDGISAVQYPGIQEKLLLLKSRSAARRKTIDGSNVSGEQTEPVVSSDELSELLKSL
ncbi:MAG: hypothetical protein LBS57_03535 [Treponema sp.]|nr:hypothetical protein [Treponema sp.]